MFLLLKTGKTNHYRLLCRQSPGPDGCPAEPQMHRASDAPTRKCSRVLCGDTFNEANGFLLGTEKATKKITSGLKI